jgi:hypothetical protein
MRPGGLGSSFLLAWLAVAEPGRASTFLFLDSEPGDPVGEGLQRFYSSADGAFQGTEVSDDRVSIAFTCGVPRCAGESWAVTFRRAGGGRLTSGRYENAGGTAPSPGERPQLGIHGYPPVHTCEALQGRFVVREVVYRSDAHLARFAADFAFTCEGAEAGLIGAVRFHAGDGACGEGSDGAPCDDRNPCSRGDRCAARACEGEGGGTCSPVTCVDRDPCTDDSVEAGQCRNEPIAGTCWAGDEGILRLVAVGSAVGRTAQCTLRCRAPLTGVVALRDDGTYRAPGTRLPGCADGATVTLPEQLGTVRRTRRGKLVFEPANRDEIATAFETCVGPSTQLRAFGTRARLSADGQLRGVSTARLRTRQAGIPVAVRGTLRFRASRVGPGAAAETTAALGGRNLPVCSPSLRPRCVVR